MINDQADKIFYSFLNRYQNNLKKLMKSSDFLFDYVHLLYYQSHEINPNAGGWNIDSPDWIKNKKEKISPINKNDNKCF